MSTQILKLNAAGMPVAWLNFEAAATTIAKDLVLWSMGGFTETLHGGYRHDGSRSSIELPAILAVKGRVKEKSVPRISNHLLFARDGNLCMYCGVKFHRSELSRDHVIPRSKGGPDVWTNCVTACRRCNQFKDDRTPQEAGLELLAVPYAPTLNEWFALSNRHVLTDQMDYLRSGFKHLSA